jgi:hypothetical protein
MYDKANFITTEKLIFDIIDIENNNIISIPLLRSTLLTNDDNYNIITLYKVIIENEEFCISLKLLVDF